MRTPRAAHAVVGVLTLCVVGSAGLLLGAGAAAGAPAPSAAPAVTVGDVNPQPRSFSFDGMSPGQTRSAIVDVASTHETDGVVAGVHVTTSGVLGASLSTTIDACTTAWQADVCSSGAVRLVEGWRGSQSGSTSQDVVVPTGTTTSLRVLVTLDEDVAQGATGSIRYDLTLRGVDGGHPGGPVDPGGSTEPDGPGGGTAPDGPGDPGGTGDSAASAAGVLPELLVKTGASIWPLAALAGGLIGIGAALLRRSRRSDPARSSDSP